MSCTGICVAKVYLLIFDVLFMITGIVVLAFGAITVVSVTDLHNAYGDISFFYVPYVLIGVGVIVIILGVLGFIAAYKEKPMLLLVFFGSLVFIFGLEVIMGILSILYSSQLEDEVTDELKESLRSYKEEAIMDTWDRLQSDLKCCGVEGYWNWGNITNSDFSKGKAPDSCCLYHSEGCGTTPGAEFHVKGCKDIVVAFVEDNMFLIGAIAVACGVFQIVGMAATLILYCSIKRKGEYV